MLSIFLPIRVQQEQVRWDILSLKEQSVPVDSGAGRDNPLLNGPTEGRVHSSARPRCGTSLIHLLQPLHVQRGIYTCWSHGCRLPSLPGSCFQLFTIPPPPRWPSSMVLSRSLVCTTALLEPELSVQALLGKQSAVHTIASKQSLLASPIHKVELITQEVHHYYFRRSYSTKGQYGKETKEKYIFENKLKTNYFSAS